MLGERHRTGYNRDVPELPTDIRIPSSNDSALSVCPHCGGNTRLVVDDRLRWVCGSCGGARVPTPDPRSHSAAEKQHLLRSKELVRNAHLISFGATLTAMGATGAALFATLYIFVAHWGGVVPLLLIGVSGVLSLLTIVFGRTARARLDEAKEQVTSAWEAVLEALMRIHDRPLTAAELGSMMNTTEPDAERLLTMLSVDDRVTSAVGEDAQIRYSLPAHLRVENPAATAATVLAPRIADPLATANTVLAPRVGANAEEEALAAEIDQLSAKTARTEQK